jgi:predicted PurR-regulated permease PerM
MTLLAYIDVRPFLFIGGLPLFIGLSLLVCWLAKARFKKGNVTLFSALLFTVLFTFFLTGVGPFIDQKEVREYMMTWETKPRPSNGMKESEVVLTFVDFPGHYIGEYSDELAAHLRDKGKQPVKVVFEVTSDYGRVRGFHETEIGGLRGWKSEWGYAGSSGSPAKSPWN